MELTVIVGDCLPPICKGPRRLTTESAGASVKFIFPGECWNSLPRKLDTFWCGPIVKTVPIEEGRAIIPDECFTIPFAPLRVEVCATDTYPDDADIARNEEIEVRIKEIYKELALATNDNELFGALLDEMRDLKKEQSNLNIVRKRRISDLCEITQIRPGIPCP